MLKQLSDGLSKVWKSDRCHEPFYRGGKVEFINDELKLACIYDEDLRIVDLATGEKLQQLSEEDVESNEVVTCFCMHPNGDEVVVSTLNFLLRHYKLSDKSCERVIRGHTMPVLAMAYDPTGTLIATGSADRTVRVWDVARGYCTHNFRDHTDIIQSVYFHPDPNRLLLFSCSEDKTIRIFDLIDNSSVACFKDHMSLPTGIALSPDGYLMASAGRDKVLNFFELRTYQHIKTVPLMEELEGVIILQEQHSKTILNIHDEKKKKTKTSLQSDHILITAGNKGALRILHVSISGTDLSSFTCTALTSLSLSPSSSSISTSNNYLMHAVRGLYYLPNKGEVVAVTADHNFCFYKIESSPDSAAPGADSLKESKQLIGCNDDILDIILIPSPEKDLDIIADDNTLSQAIVKGNTMEQEKKFQMALITNSPQIRLMDQDFSSTPLDGHTDIVLAADISPDGKFLASSSKDRTVRVWNLATKTCYAVGEGHADAVGAVCISQKQATYQSKLAFVISGAGDKILKRWPLPMGGEGVTKLVVSHNVRGHDKDINTLAVSPNDSMVASGSQDKTIRLWRTADLAPIATLSGHKRGVWKVAFSPVDRCLVSCSGDRTLRLWSVVDYSCLRVFEGHTASVLTVQFVNKGMQLLSGAADGLIRLWTIRSGESENTFDMHSDRVWAIAVGPSGDSKLYVWDDVTQLEETKRLDEAESNLLLEQQLQNDIRGKRYDKAMTTALSLGHSNKVLNIFMAILDDDIKEEDRSKVKEKVFQNNLHIKLDCFTLSWSDEDIAKIVSYLVEWNTNAKHSFVSQAVLNSIIRVVKTDRIMAIKPVSEAIPGLLAYSERHYSRVDRLHQATYVLEYMSSLMQLLPIDEERINLDEENPKKTSSKASSGGGVSKIVGTPVLFAPLKKVKKTEVIENSISEIANGNEKKKRKVI